MSLLDALLARVRPRQEQDWVAQEFHTVIACYGRTRQVQSSTPEAPRLVHVPEQPMRFRRGR
jgi:hypothetical protein